MRTMWGVVAGLIALQGIGPFIGTARGQESPDAQELYSLELEDLLSIHVVSASKTRESLQEAPVPITVITAEMLRAIGARNLQDALTTYVPGMTLVADHNELNVAMRGVYASSQQKILVLLDGHRLNSRAYSMANPDFSIGIDWDKVKQIEVLRGPGSSLYGNVALTAVVNVITKSAEEMKGASAFVGGGDFVSRGDTQWLRSDSRLLAAGRTLGFNLGTKLAKDGDLTLWGQVFDAPGERVTIDAASDYSPAPRTGEAILGGASEPYSYDFGLRLRQGDLTLLADTRFGKTTEPFTSAGAPTGQVYDYDQFRTFLQTSPGLGSRSDHLSLTYDRALSERFNLSANVYYDRNDLRAVLVSNPSGNAVFLGWNDDALGAIVDGTLEYDLGGVGHGDALLGIQVDRMRLIDSLEPVASGGEWTGFGDSSSTPVLEPGHETIYSAFAQIRHRFTDQLLLNAGMRFDDKNRHRGADVHQLSPRVALVWLPSAQVDVKLSYAESFVDAPYWYRYNSLASYQGSSNLQPERLRSVQLTPTVAFFDGALKNTVNIFYNRVFDIVYRDPNATGSEPRYRNAGEIESFGVEEELAWIQPRYRVRANVTYQHELNAEDYGAADGEIDNVPSLVGNGVLELQPVESLRGLWLSVVGRYVGEQRAPITTAGFADDAHRLPAHGLLNVGVHAKDIVPGVDVDAVFYNAFDERYAQGGSVAHPYPQPGRFYMVWLRYRG